MNRQSTINKTLLIVVAFLFLYSSQVFSTAQTAEVKASEEHATSWDFICLTYSRISDLSINCKIPACRSTYVKDFGENTVSQLEDILKCYSVQIEKSVGVLIIDPHAHRVGYKMANDVDGDVHNRTIVPEEDIPKLAELCHKILIAGSKVSALQETFEKGQPLDEAVNAMLAIEKDAYMPVRSVSVLRGKLSTIAEQKAKAGEILSPATSAYIANYRAISDTVMATSLDAEGTTWTVDKTNSTQGTASLLNGTVVSVPSSVVITDNKSNPVRGVIGAGTSGMLRCQTIGGEGVVSEIHIGSGVGGIPRF